MDHHDGSIETTKVMRGAYRNHSGGKGEHPSNISLQPSDSSRTPSHHQSNTEQGPSTVKPKVDRELESCPPQSRNSGIDDKDPHKPQDRETETGHQMESVFTLKSSPTSPSSQQADSRFQDNSHVPRHIPGPSNTTEQRMTGPSRVMRSNRHSPSRPGRRTSPPQVKEAQLRQNVKPDATEIRLFVNNFPAGCGTKEVYEILEDKGNIVYIKLERPRRDGSVDACVVFKPVPKDLSWVRDGITIQRGTETGHLNINTPQHQNGPNEQISPLDAERKFAEETAIALTELSFGVMKSDREMLEFVTTMPIPTMPTRLILNLKRKCLEIEFPIFFESVKKHRLFKLKLNLAQITRVVKMDSPSGDVALVINTTMPPMLYRKADNFAEPHEKGGNQWTEWQTWYRQTSIERDQETARKAATQLQKHDALVDVGRWLTYKLVFSASVADSKPFKEFCIAFYHHNVTIEDDRAVSIQPSQSHHLWNWLDDAQTVAKEAAGSSALSALHQLAVHTVHLPFALRYQLEACISNGVLHESNIDDTFLTKLAGLEDHGVRLLEKATDENKRLSDPRYIFRLTPRHGSNQKSSYSCWMRSAQVTPTTIYFASPTEEVTNSIIRKYPNHEDCFLRIKFTDERYKGKIWSSEDKRDNEIFTRVHRTMTNGIHAGSRHYDFLAFSNSQCREAGAYFFASSKSLTAQQIRDGIGNLDHILEVPKYCARLGQALSTTRALPLQIKVEKIPDIERNGHCFTDGVGKISPFLARMIASDHQLPTGRADSSISGSAVDYPSVFQFRLGGGKGILAVDPKLSGNVVQIRASQEKFKIPLENWGLDICRISQFSAANLNMQLILVLSTLGVKDATFLQMMDHQLRDLEIAMTNEEKAHELLQRNVDYNQMTIQISSMIADGFMEIQDPFMITCLKLWRAWNIKYLKEKARIYVDQGAFVFGCVDEIGVLRGHFNDAPGANGSSKDEGTLPEVFLQIEDPGSRTGWKVPTGKAVLVRNPSLHPGDVRVVRLVDRAELHHLRNCVVMPQTGDQDLPSMCSGGDLDGDDYLVMWDPALIPEEWNHAPMDYSAPESVKADGPITVEDITSFFVTHLKNANVSKIAVSHRYWADWEPDGVKSPKCLELAQLHSKAVDYMKTGVPAVFPQELTIKKWPHWAGDKKFTYRSHKILGQLYDKVQMVQFRPDWDLPFDKRILEAYELSEEMLQAARVVKEEYDSAIKRIMAKYSIKSEFEVWTTFVMEHSDDVGDYKFAEKIGEDVNILKDHHQKLCYEAAGTSRQDEKYWEKMGPFITAMYTITERELKAALAECNEVKLVRGVQVSIRERLVESMPFISFPWLFPRELGIIANKGTASNGTRTVFPPRAPTFPRKTKKDEPSLLPEDFVLPDLPEVNISKQEPPKDSISDVKPEMMALRSDSAKVSENTLEEIPPMISKDNTVIPTANENENEQNEEDVDVEQVAIDFEDTALDNLEDLMGE